MKGESGKYAFGVINAKESRSYGKIGIEGEEVYTVIYRDIAVVVCDFAESFVDPSRENLLGHEKVVTEIMGSSTILPFGFGHLFETAADVKSFLRRNLRVLKKNLEDIDNKVQLLLKVYWSKASFRKELFDSCELDKMKEKMRSLPEDQLEQAQIDFGMIVSERADNKRLFYENEIGGPFKNLAADFEFKDVTGERMVINAVFLVDRKNEADFDMLVSKFQSKYQEKLILNYSGPWAPYDFVNLNLNE